MYHLKQSPSYFFKVCFQLKLLHDLRWPRQTSLSLVENHIGGFPVVLPCIVHFMGTVKTPRKTPAPKNEAGLEELTVLVKDADDSENRPGLAHDFLWGHTGNLGDSRWGWRF